MGFFDKLRKKPEPAPQADEKKLEEVARYRAREHQVIRDLQVKALGKVGTYIEGKVYCRLWDTEIDVDLYDDVPLDYVEKCAEAMNAMPDELVDAICRAAKKYCLEFLDAVGGAAENGIELTVPVDENTPPVMILHGSSDHVVPISQSEIFYEKLCEQGIRAEYLVLNGADHGEDYFYQEVIQKKVLQFLNEVL